MFIILIGSLIFLCPWNLNLYYSSGSLFVSSLNSACGNNLHISFQPTSLKNLIWKLNPYIEFLAFWNQCPFQIDSTGRILSPFCLLSLVRSACYHSSFCRKAARTGCIWPASDSYGTASILAYFHYLIPQNYVCSLGTFL